MKDGDINNFRDPKIWFSEETKQYYLVIGNSIRGVGSVLLYATSDDNLEDWQFKSVLYQYTDSNMIECPNLV